MGGHTTAFCEEERFVKFLHNSFNAVKLLFPAVGRIISAGGDGVHTIPPVYVVLLIFIGIIGNHTMIYLTDLGDELTPFGTSSLGHYHLTAGTENFTFGFFGNFSKVKLKFRIGCKPLAPFGLTGNILIKKINMCTPGTVLTIYSGL